MKKKKKIETKMGAKVRKIKNKINTTTTITTVKIETYMITTVKTEMYMIKTKAKTKKKAKAKAKKKHI